MMTGGKDSNDLNWGWDPILTNDYRQTHKHSFSFIARHNSIIDTFFRHGRQISMTQWLICPIREFFQDFILVTLSNYEGRHLFQCGYPKVQYLLEGRACLRPGACQRINDIVINQGYGVWKTLKKEGVTKKGCFNLFLTWKSALSRSNFVF